MHLFIGIGLFICCLPSICSAAEDFAAAIYEGDAGTIPYRIHLPQDLKKKERVPLVILMHGAGERGTDNKKQLRHGAKDLLAYLRAKNIRAIVVAPQCPNGQQWVDTPWGDDSHSMPKEPSKPMRALIGLTKEIVSKQPVDRKRMYVTGLSMGGFGTWDLIQRMPDSFAAAIAVCGGGDTAMAIRLTKMPIWAFHGGNDNVVKTQRSRDMVAAIKAAGGKLIKYTEYPGVGHGSWGPTYKNAEALDWFFAQQKK